MTRATCQARMHKKSRSATTAIQPHFIVTPHVACFSCVEAVVCVTTYREMACYQIPQKCYSMVDCNSALDRNAQQPRLSCAKAKLAVTLAYWGPAANCTSTLFSLYRRNCIYWAAIIKIGSEVMSQLKTCLVNAAAEVAWLTKPAVTLTVLRT